MFNTIDSGKSFIIFGAGEEGKECCAFLKQNNRHINFFVDNDSAKWGKEIDGVSIRRPVDIKKADPQSSIIVIACTYKEQEIAYQMVHMGIYIKYEIIRLLELYKPQMKQSYCEQDAIIQNSFPDTKGGAELLYDFQIFYEQKNGGVARYYYEIIKRIVMRYRVDLFEGFNKTDYSLVHMKNSFNRYYKMEYEGVKGGRHILNSSLLHSFVKDRKYEIYHPTYYHDYELDNAKTCIITVYDMIHELYQFDQTTISEKKNMIAKADGIIAISESTKRDLIEIYNVDERKVKVIYLANSLSKKNIGKRIIEEPYILYVGRRNGYKNAKTLIKAFAQCRHKKDLKLVFFSGENFSDNDSKLFSELGLLQNIERLSGSDEVLANLYNYAEVFVYPSLYEGFGLPILEAMHFGTPVITSNTASLPEVGGDAAIYFNPESAEDLSECIDKLLDDQDTRGKTGQAGIRREKMFSWDRCAKEHMKYYGQFLS